MEQFGRPSVTVLNGRGREILILFRTAHRDVIAALRHDELRKRRPTRGALLAGFRRRGPCQRATRVIVRSH